MSPACAPIARKVRGDRVRALSWARTDSATTTIASSAIAIVERESRKTVLAGFLLDDGSSCDGVVSVRPSVQVFRDPQGREGLNAEVQLERPDAPTWHQRVWLDRIQRVEHVDSIMASEN